jgi:tRNA(fMet)-specific endonuclease VapC
VSPSIRLRPVQGVLDTSVVVQLGRIGDPGLLPEQPLITAMTLAELAVGALVPEDEAERARRQAQLQQAEVSFDPLPFDSAAARAFARVALSLRRAGRKHEARGYDAIIAAIALSRALPVYTCNQADFLGIEGLDVVPVAVPAPG